MCYVFSKTRIFENCFFVLKNKENNENMKNMFGSFFFFL